MAHGNLPLIIEVTTNLNERKEITMSTQNSNTISFKGKHFFVGFDVHKTRWVVTIRHSGMHLKTFSMDPYPEGLKNYLEKNYPEGIYHLVYEVGFCGFWIYRRFKHLGVDCLVINPADVPTAHKEKERKSDPVDSRKLARELEWQSARHLCPYRGWPAPEELVQALHNNCPELYPGEEQNQGSPEF